MKKELLTINFLDKVLYASEIAKIIIIVFSSIIILYLMWLTIPAN